MSSSVATFVIFLVILLPALINSIKLLEDDCVYNGSEVKKKKFWLDENAPPLIIDFFHNNKLDKLLIDIIDPNYRYVHRISLQMDSLETHFNGPGWYRFYLRIKRTVDYSQKTESQIELKDDLEKSWLSENFNSSLYALRTNNYFQVEVTGDFSFLNCNESERDFEINKVAKDIPLAFDSEMRPDAFLFIPESTTINQGTDPVLTFIKVTINYDRFYILNAENEETLRLSASSSYSDENLKLNVSRTYRFESWKTAMLENNSNMKSDGCFSQIIKFVIVGTDQTPVYLRAVLSWGAADPRGVKPSNSTCGVTTTTSTTTTTSSTTNPSIKLSHWYIIGGTAAFFILVVGIACIISATKLFKKKAPLLPPPPIPMTSRTSRTPITPAGSTAQKRPGYDDDENIYDDFEYPQENANANWRHREEEDYEDQEQDDDDLSGYDPDEQDIEFVNDMYVSFDVNPELII